ncbi:MAG: putative pre-16S rRNA nuclease [Gemmatimonadales bacterium]|nr:Putative pre-16S rRNA nuclease [bacterium HR33]GIW51850.1 MAG: putative pre-16S rRNA nuclease [Gemmatimonadales bacterium]
MIARQGRSPTPPGDPSNRLPETAALPEQGRLLAIDPGEKRIGLAVSDPAQTVAQPLATLTRRAGRRFPLRRLREHIEAQEVVGVVIGLPLDPSGEEGQKARAAREIGEEIRRHTGLAVAYLDERMTTAQALKVARAIEAKPRRHPERVDRMAAAILLQNFLDSRRSQRL